MWVEIGTVGRKKRSSLHAVVGSNLENSITFAPYLRNTFAPYLGNRDQFSYRVQLLELTLSKIEFDQDLLVIYGLGSYFNAESFNDVDLVLVFENESINSCTIAARNLVSSAISSLGFCPHVMAMTVHELNQFPKLIDEFLVEFRQHRGQQT